ncbi:MAG: hypothetical protein GEV10_28500 [Streptosporangiales bacterium]|nr:hypothetical protein [Streptosporangiales bacterium]
MPPASPAAITRRGVLQSLAVAGLAAAGCRPLFRESGPPPRPDPDVVVTVRALTAEDQLLVAYAAVAERHPKLAGELAAFRKRHEAHRAALVARLPAGHLAGRTPTPSASPSPTGTTTATPSATDVADLVEAEREAAADRVTDALAAGPTLAQVLAGMGACAAAHAQLLRRWT